MKYLMIFLGIGISLLIADYKVYAAAPSVNGLTISPAIEQINLTQGQQSASFTTLVTNNTKSTLTIKVTARDFSSVNELGGIGFLNTSEGALTNNHGLANDLKFEKTQLVIVPGQTESELVSIENDSSLASGGHYAAILYSISNPSSPIGNSISIDQTLSSLVFVSTYGQGTQSINLTTPVISSFYSSIPNNINLVFSNNGNTQTTPSGLVQIYGPNSKLIVQGTININSGLILPGSKRLFNVTLLAKNTNYLHPGIYHFKITYGHDGQSNYAIYETSFLYISASVLVVGSMVVILVIVLLYKLFGIVRKFRKNYYKNNKQKIKNVPQPNVTDKTVIREIITQTIKLSRNEDKNDK